LGSWKEIRDNRVGKLEKNKKIKFGGWKKIKENKQG